MVATDLLLKACQHVLHVPKAVRADFSVSASDNSLSVHMLR